ATMNPSGNYSGGGECQPKLPWAWRCSLLEPDDVAGVAAAYGGTPKPPATPRALPVLHGDRGAPAPTRSRRPEHGNGRALLPAAEGRADPGVRRSLSLALGRLVRRPGPVHDVPFECDADGRGADRSALRRDALAMARQAAACRDVSRRTGQREELVRGLVT